MSVTYTATLPVRQRTVVFLTSLLDAERSRRGTRAGRRAVSTFDQAVLVLRWFLDATRMRQLAGVRYAQACSGQLSPEVLMLGTRRRPNDAVPS